MKKILFFLIIVSICNIIQAQVPSSCTIPQLLATKYDRDIKLLAAKRLFDLKSPDTNLVRIPQIYVDSIAQGLAAIYNATSIPESDSVFNLYCVHNRNGWTGAHSGFIVKVDISYPWTTAWQNLITTTGDPLMDTILTKYNLQIREFLNWSFGKYAILYPVPSADSSWNNLALNFCHIFHQ